MIWRFGYQVLLWLLFPWVLGHLWWRGIRQPAYRENIAERFGYYTVQPGKPVIWLHAVSVGETRAAEPLIRSLIENYPRHALVLTQMTPTGRETAQSLYSGVATICYLPYDYAGAVDRFLSRLRPRLGIIMETEVWPNLVSQCSRDNVPLMLANARMSEKSARGYEMAGALAKGAFGALTVVGAQSEGDADRLRRLGARDVEITGNLKFDVSIAPHLLHLGAEMRESFGNRPVLLAASTREGEEELILKVLESIPVPGMLLILVPRHPQRFDEVAELIARRDLGFVRRSENRPPSADCKVMLGDSMGEMAAYYQACDLAFVGGSLLPFGGQNLIEACAVGRPVLHGPYMYNFDEASRLAGEAGAALEVVDAEMLAQTAGELLCDESRLARMSKAATEFSKAHRGATQRNMAICARLLGTSRV